jgi:type VI secretion system protein ImpL
MDDFFQRNLAQMVDISKSPWQFRAAGNGTPAASASLTSFQHAATIRDVYFRSGGQAQISLDIKPLELDPGLSQVQLDIDGQVIKFSGGQAMSQRVTWPGPRGSNLVRMQAGSSVLTTEGPWAIYRFFDRAQVQTGNSAEKLRATFNLDGRRVVFAVNANSVQNPLRLREFAAFSCPGKL